MIFQEKAHSSASKQTDNLLHRIAVSLSDLHVLSEETLDRYNTLSNIAMTLTEMISEYGKSYFQQPVNSIDQDFIEAAFCCVRFLVFTLDDLYIRLPRNAESDDLHGLVTLDLAITLCEISQNNHEIVAYINKISDTILSSNRRLMIKSVFSLDDITGRLLQISGTYNERPLKCLKGLKSYVLDKYSNERIVVR